MSADFQPVRRVAAYAICADDSARVLLVRESARSGTPGVWTLPGGAVWHGEQPSDTVIRETRAETGLAVRPANPSDVVADTRIVVGQGVTIHTDRLLFEAEVAGSAGPVPSSAGVDDARWVTRDEAASLQLRPFAANALKLPLTAVDLPPEEMPDLPSFHIVQHPDGRRRVQRFAAYAVVRDEHERVLLTRIADGFPGAGRWHLPGGGTDFGEQPAEALLRELTEETGYAGRVLALLGTGSHHEPDQVGPEGFPIDWHGVRAYYDVALESAEPVHDREDGGSTAEARWIARRSLEALPLSRATAEALALVTPFS